MEISNIALPLLTSLLIGALIGLEREKTKQTTKGLSAIGIRTDILISLYGALAAFLGQHFSPLLFILCLCSILIFTISSYIYLMVKHERIGITTEISTILVFLYGAMAMGNYMQLAIILGIITTLILSVREYIHAAIKNLNYHELFDTIKFAIIAFIILPLLPNKNFDQEVFSFLLPNQPIPSAFNSINVLNPYNIWFLVVLVSGISFLGYILIKIFGKNRGITFAGLVGGLYSSTATSLTLSNKSKELPKTKSPFVAGIILACAISFIRTFIEIKTLNNELFIKTFPTIALMGMYLLTIGFLIMVRSKKETIKDNTNFQTPFSLKKALKLAIYIMCTLFIGKILLSYSSLEWYYLTAGAMALFAIDDPVILSTASTAGKLINYEHAKNIVILVTYLNMVQKVGIIYFFGNRKLVKPLAAIFGGLLLVTLAGLLYL